ncbi:hypothetical protein C8R47DRAFT_1226138 [Mycena vitilis]|nr:hypothetical protein C8R47DRAFT_1226138 [Mycena vitilis]
MQLKPEVARHEAERQPLPPDEVKEWMSAKEQEDGKTLAEITGTDYDLALRILRKHDGNMDKAADNLLNGVVDDPEERSREESLKSIKQDFGYLFPDGDGKKRAVEQTVIDLTKDDDDDLPMDTRFRATTRSPDPAWQMVRSNQPVVDVKSEDDQLKEVMQASWNDFAAEESDTIPNEDFTQREGGRPVALRADAAGKAYAALVIQCLFHIPQVRQRCSKLHLHQGETFRSNPEWALWTLIEMFTALDHGAMNVIIDADLLKAWETAPLTQTDSVGKISKDFLERVVRLLQSELDLQKIEAAPGLNKLFHFTYGMIHLPPTGPPVRTYEPDVGHVVSVHIDPGAPAGENELVARLSATLNTVHADGSSEHQLIQHASEMVSFEISVNPNPTPHTGTGGAEPFVFPKCVYMDQFMEVNLDLANETRLAERQFRTEVEELRNKKKALTRFEDQDTFENLRGSIDYCERVAQCDSPERLAMLRTMATKLKNTLKKLEGEVAAIDEKVLGLQSELDVLWENPELQCYPYDLRAVLVHTGLPGRKHIYSYVHDKGTWWKTVDYTVTEVSEDVVLSDPAGLHLGAGPYLLLYSRRQSEEEGIQRAEWPPIFVSTTAENNARFLSEGQAMKARAEEREDDAMDLS